VGRRQEEADGRRGGRSQQGLDARRDQGARREGLRANCAVCHQPNGKGGGAFPALDGSKVVNGPKAGQMHILLEGKGGMPSWKQLSDTELAAVMTYTRNSWSNKTGEVIQPADFSQARAGKFPEGGGARKPADAAQGRHADHVQRQAGQPRGQPRRRLTRGSPAFRN
jgi:cytochrome c oxidase subunit 2